MAEQQPLDLTPRLADLTGVRLSELSKLQGDSALETTLRRLVREVEHPREAVSGFSSAI